MSLSLRRALDVDMALVTLLLSPKSELRPTLAAFDGEMLST